MTAPTAAIALLVALAACDAPPPPTATASRTADSTQMDLAGTEWAIVDVGARRMTDGTAPTLAFSRDHVSGFDGCNSFSAGYELRGERFRATGDVISDLQLCAPPVMEQADAVQSAVTRAANTRRTSGELAFVDSAGVQLLTLRPLGEVPPFLRPEDADSLALDIARLDMPPVDDLGFSRHRLDADGHAGAFAEGGVVYVDAALADAALGTDRLLAYARLATAEGVRQRGERPFVSAAVVRREADAFVWWYEPGAPVGLFPREVLARVLADAPLGRAARAEGFEVFTGNPH